MTYTTRADFMSGLREALGRNNIPDARDILIDFDQHFDGGAAAGESEADVCAKLGDVDEIVKQYISETDGRFTEAQKETTVQETVITDNEPEKTMNTGDFAQTAKEASAPVIKNERSGPSAGGIVGVIFMDIFLFSWTLITLLSLIISLYAVTIAFAASGIAIFVGAIMIAAVGAAGFISTGFAPISLIFCGIMMCAFGGMLVIASIAATRGFINLIIAVINLNARRFTGHNVCRNIGRKYREERE